MKVYILIYFEKFVFLISSLVFNFLLFLDFNFLLFLDFNFLLFLIYLFRINLFFNFYYFFEILKNKKKTFLKDKFTKRIN